MLDLIYSFPVIVSLLGAIVLGTTQRELRTTKRVHDEVHRHHSCNDLGYPSITVIVLLGVVVAGMVEMLLKTGGKIEMVFVLLLQPFFRNMIHVIVWLSALIAHRFPRRLWQVVCWGAMCHTLFVYIFL